MNETRRTAGFLAVAAGSLILAWLFAPTTEITPQELASANLGQEFYPEFQDPNEPTSLRVVSYNDQQAIAKVFAVELKDGVWRIPSHHNYPADAADRLAKTAASVIGIKREEIRSTSPADYAELGVIDPLDEDLTELKGRGQRVTLSKGGTPVVDLIIGKQLKDRPGYYFVRRPDEKSTYVAKLDIDLSTKFGDWVETDLLKIDRDSLVEIIENNYSVDEARGRVVDGEVNDLSRDKPADPWKLAGLDEKTEELDTAKINEMVSALDDLKLAGVRPKPAGLSEDLKLDKGIRIEPATMLDLRSKGFLFTPQNELVSNEGELIASTNKGVTYILRFGEVFTGSEEEVEIGLGAEKQKEKAAKKKAEEDQKKDSGDSTSKASRYLFVTAHFDPKYLGPVPQKPEEPAETATPSGKKPESAEVPADKSGNAAKNPETPKETTKPVEPEASKTEAGKEAGKTEAAKSEKPEAAKPDKPESDKPESDKPESDKPDVKSEDSCGGPPASDESEEDSPAADAKSEADSDAKPADKTADKETAEKKPAEKPADKPATQKPADSKPEPSAKETPAKKDEPVKKEAAAEKPKPADSKPAKKQTPPPPDAKQVYQELLKKYKADVKAYDEKVKAGQEEVASLNKRFADWYYVISADSFAKLHVARKDLVKPKGKPGAADATSPATQDIIKGLMKNLPKSANEPAEPAQPAAPKAKAAPEARSKAATKKPAAEETSADEKPAAPAKPAKKSDDATKADAAKVGDKS